MPAQDLTDHIQRRIFCHQENPKCENFAWQPTIEIRYLTNHPCMLLSLLEDMYINIGYRNGLPPETAAAALQSVWAKVGEEGKK